MAGNRGEDEGAQCPLVLIVPPGRSFTYCDSHPSAFSLMLMLRHEFGHVPLDTDQRLDQGMRGRSGELI